MPALAWLLLPMSSRFPERTEGREELRGYAAVPVRLVYFEAEEVGVVKESGAIRLRVSANLKQYRSDRDAGGRVCPCPETPSPLQLQPRG